MKAPIRASVLAALLTLTVAAPVFADAPVVTHESSSSCQTDPVSGITVCLATESTVRAKETRSGAVRYSIQNTFEQTVLDANGAMISSFESVGWAKEQVLVADGDPVVQNVNMWRQEERSEGGVTTCTQYRVLVKHETERINSVTTTEGPC
jgi:hypothetical protein